MSTNLSLIRTVLNIKRTFCTQTISLFVHKYNKISIYCHDIIVAYSIYRLILAISIYFVNSYYSKSKKEPYYNYSIAPLFRILYFVESFGWDCKTRSSLSQQIKPRSRSASGMCLHNSEFNCVYFFLSNIRGRLLLWGRGGGALIPSFR